MSQNLRESSGKSVSLAFRQFLKESSVAGYYEPKIKTGMNLKRRVHKQLALWRAWDPHWDGIDAGLLSEKDTLAVKIEGIFQGTWDKEVLGTVLSRKKILWSLQPCVSLGSPFSIAS